MFPCPPSVGYGGLLPPTTTCMPGGSVISLPATYQGTNAKQQRTSAPHTVAVSAVRCCCAMRKMRIFAVCRRLCSLAGWTQQKYHFLLPGGRLRDGTRLGSSVQELKPCNLKQSALATFHCVCLSMLLRFAHRAGRRRCNSGELKTRPPCSDYVKLTAIT